MRLMVIFNPHAGHGRAKKIIEPLKKYLSEKHAEITWLFTSYPGHAVEIATEAHLDHFDGVIAAGGDGTLFEIINGLHQNKSGHRPVLGIVPTGTGNAFARELGLSPDDWQKAADIISAGKTRMVDLGRFITGDETRYFINIIGCGFVSDVSATAHKLKIFGYFSYILGVFYRLIFLKSIPMKLKTDKTEMNLKGIFIEVSNSRYTGKSFLMAPDAEVDDGFLDITILNKIGRFKLLKIFPTIFTGKHIHVPDVTSFKARYIEITTDKPYILTPDGELIGHTPVTIDVIKHGIKVFWP